METKMVRIDFDLELAKAITNGEKEGRIVTREGKSARIICWDADDKDFPIVALITEVDGEIVAQRTKKGVLGFSNEQNERDLMLEIPEYLTFKDGDILFARTNGNNCWFFIYRDNGKDITSTYAAIDNDGTLWIEDNRITSNDDILELKSASENERQKLIDALKQSSNPRAKECLAKLGIKDEPKPSNSSNNGKNYEFKPFDRVLVRCGNDNEWTASIYSHKCEGEYPLHCCLNGRYEECIPYEGNEHLLGKQTM